MPNNPIVIGGKKFLWDGVDHVSKDSAYEMMQKYKIDGFETELQEEEGKAYLYTRRVVKETAVST